jgi:hypothetical protein
MLVFYFTVGLLPNVEPRNGNIEAFLVAGILYAIIIMGLPWVTDFFKQNYNYVSFFIFGSILSILYFYLMENVFLGILDINPLMADQRILGLTFLDGFTWNINETIVWSGIISILLQLLNEFLLDRA